MKHLSSILVLSLVLLSCFVVNVYAYDVDDYYPTNQGNSWVFNEKYTNSDGKNLEYSSNSYISGYEDVNYGGATYSGFKFYDAGNGSLNYRVRRITANGIENIKSAGASGTNDRYRLYGSISSPSPEGPYLWIPHSFNIGDTYEFDYKTYEYDTLGTLKNTYTTNSKIILEGLEDVSVPAGDFKDCLKLKVIENEKRTDLDIYREGYGYVAKGVGIIKDSTDLTWVGMDNISHWEKYSSELVNANVVPEPASCLLFGIGGAAMAFAKRKKRAA